MVPVLAKIIMALVVAYALSPVDLIPDFIPVIGYLDDLLLLPLGIWLTIQLIPKPVWQAYQNKAAEQIPVMPRSRQAAIVIVFIWFIVIVAYFG